MLHHLELQLPDGAEQHQRAELWLEHLNGALLAQLREALLCCLLLSGFFSSTVWKQFWRKERQPGELQAGTVGDGVAAARRREW